MIGPGRPVAVAVALAVAVAAAGCTCAGERDAPPTPPPSSTVTPPPATAAPPASLSPEPAPVAPAGFAPRTWHVETPFGPSDVVVLVPGGAPADAKLPVLVAFHGRGESLKGPRRGPLGWLSDYGIGAAALRLGEPPLSVNDFGGMITDARLAALNASLKARPYRGLIVVCPYLPDTLKGPEAFPQGQKLAGFVVDRLLPRVYAETPAAGTPETTSVDGVSLGGRAALLVGLLRPEAFGAVSAMQPALDDEEAPLFADLAAKARGARPEQHLRLLTSDEDYFLVPTQSLGKALTTRHVAHRLDVVVGPHNYEFNRGPGSYEMLLYHERTLRGAPAP